MSKRSFSPLSKDCNTSTNSDNTKINSFKHSNQDKKRRRIETNHLNQNNIINDSVITRIDRNQKQKCDGRNSTSTSLSPTHLRRSNRIQHLLEQKDTTSPTATTSNTTKTTTICGNSQTLKQTQQDGTMKINPDIVIPIDECTPDIANKITSTVTEDIILENLISPTKNKKNTTNNDKEICHNDSLPRTIETELFLQRKSLKYVIGIDEAGRGPLAGPVVVAAVSIPHFNDEDGGNNNSNQDDNINTNNYVTGVMDSKKISKEKDREELYERIVRIPHIRWAVAIVSSNVIDQINILQATLLGMKMATVAVMGMHNHSNNNTCSHNVSNMDPTIFGQRNTATNVSNSHESYVVLYRNESQLYRGGIPTQPSSPQAVEPSSASSLPTLQSESCHALIDGNKIPNDMPCSAQCIVGGDGKEYIIAIASVLAKVTRDRLMHEYHKIYPQYNLEQHKGYPTSAHMIAVRTFGASPIHRRSFAPLKHMTFDSDGCILHNVQDIQDNDGRKPKTTAARRKRQTIG